MSLTVICLLLAIATMAGMTVALFWLDKNWWRYVIGNHPDDCLCRSCYAKVTGKHR